MVRWPRWSSMRIYQLNSDKITAFALQNIIEKGQDKGRTIYMMIMAPMALLEVRGKYYTTTKNLKPREVIDYGYQFDSITAGIKIPLHPIWDKDGQAVTSQTPTHGFGTTPKELIEEYSYPTSLGVWFEDPEVKLAWQKFINSLTD